MSVVIETTLGDITVDLFLSQRPRACLNFLKLCKTKYYNFHLFHTISRGFVAQTGDPTGTRSGGESIFGILEGQSKRFYEGENEPRIKHTKMGLISFVGNEERMIGSQFFLTLGEDLTYLDERHCVFGEVVEGYDILEIINEVICDTDDRPYQDVRITHTVILDDPYPDPKTLSVPSRSPSPSAERLQGGRIAPDEDVDETEGKNVREIAEMQAEHEAKARATILEMVGDLPDAEMAPPENVLFVCKLNPVTTDDDLEIIFNRFGKIKSCEVIRDRKTNDSLQYAFIEFEDEKSCEDAYFKMDNILIDDRRIHVDFSQSVSKIKWHGKGRGVTHYDDRGKRTKDNNNEIGTGGYKMYSSEKRDSSRKNNSSNSKNSRNKRDNSSEKRDSSRNNNSSNGRNERHKSYSKSPTRNKDKSEKLRPLSKKPEKYDQRMQSKTLRRISRSRSRSPRRQRFSSRSPDHRNDRKVPPRRRDTPMAYAYGKNRSDHRNANYSRNRDRSRSPINCSLTRRYHNENRRHKTSSRSNHNERYSKSESRQESSNHLRRAEITQSEKDRFSNKKERYISKSKDNSHKKGTESSEDSEAENKNKINKEPNLGGDYSKAEGETKVKKEIKHSRDLQSKNNKNLKKKQKYRKDSSESEEKTRKKKKKSKESSDSSSESSSSDSSSDSSTSESSDSSSESESSDSEIEQKKKRKIKKRGKNITDESSDSDSSSRNKPKKKRKKPQSSDSDSEESSRKKTKKTKKKS